MEKKKPVSEAQKRAHKKYMSDFVEVKVRMTPERRSVVQAHAEAMGETMARDSGTKVVFQDGMVI